MERLQSLVVVVGALVLGALIVYLLLGNGQVQCSSANISKYISDSDYIEMAKNTPMVKRFLETYPNSIVEVERGEDVAIVFSAKNKANSSNQIQFKLHINSSTNWPQNGEIIYNEDIVFDNDTQLDPYLGNRTCMENDYR